MGNFSIHKAVMENNLELLQKLLQNGKDVNSRNMLQCTPLHVACVKQCNKEIFECLLKYNVDINAKDVDNTTPLHFAIMPKLYDTEVISRPADFVYYNGSKKDILKGKSKVNFEIVKLLIEHGAYVNATNNHFDTPLFLAVKIINNVEVVKYLLEKGAKVNVKNEYDSTPLHITIIINSLLKENNCITIMKLLIKFGADLSVKNKFDDTPLSFILEHKFNFEIIKLLIEHGAEVNTVNSDNETSLHLAVKRKSLKNIKFLIKHGANVNAVDFEYKTPFLNAIESGRNIKMINYLIKNGMDLYAKDYINSTSLHYAAKTTNNIEVMQFLIDKGIDVNAKNDCGQTPLICSLKDYDTSIVNIKYLLERGADLNVEMERESTVLHEAAENISNGREIIQLFINSGIDVNVKNESNETPLHLAANSNRIENMKVLIENNADVNVKNKYNETPFHSALENKSSVEIFNLLLEKGAIIDADFINKLETMNKRFYNLSEASLHRAISDLLRLKALHLISDEICLKWQPLIEPKLKAWKIFEKRCNVEVCKMQNEIICSNRNINFEHILTKRLRAVAIYLQIGEVKEKINNKSYKETFPIFSEMLENKIEEGYDLADLLNESYAALKSFLKLPDIALLKILNELDEEDLKKLCSIND